MTQKQTGKKLPMAFFGNFDMSVYFNAHQKLIKGSNIPIFYRDIHNIWMGNFRHEPLNVRDLLEQSLWLHRDITIKGSSIYWGNWVKSGITKIGHIIDKKGNFYSHTEIKQKYNISCNFINILTLKQSIPFKWRQTLNTTSKICHSVDNQVQVKCDKNYQQISKMKCKDLYWHLLNKDMHIPAAKHKWSETFSLLAQSTDEIWSRIFNMPFEIIRETKLQSFQYKIIHRIIACNKWLENIKVKTDSICNFCNEQDTLDHFFLNCPNTKTFWNHWHNWWTFITDLNISHCEPLEECILLGFPGEDDIIKSLNYCVLLAKHFIYTNKMSQNEDLDLYRYLIYLKQKLTLEHDICLKNNETELFDKYLMIYEAL